MPTTAATSTGSWSNGIEVQARSAWVITIRDGKQASLTLYQSMDDALAAARGADSAG